jgi:DNA-binding LacI/PurR family transcriptional regulator
MNELVEEMPNRDKKNAVINIRVSEEFKKRIVEAIRDTDYTITRVLVEGAKQIIKKLHND